MTDMRALIFEHMAEVVRALGSAHRLTLLELTSQGERSVDSLSRLCGLSLANTSHHLQLLRRAGFVESRREGKNVFYSLSGAPVQPLLTALRKYTEHTCLEVQKIIEDSFYRLDSLQPITTEELLKRIVSDDVVLLDARPVDEFNEGHLPGAINVPPEKVMHCLSSKLKQKEIIAYCRGPYCVLSYEIVSALRQKGYTIRRLEHGFPEWKASGLPIEK